MPPSARGSASGLRRISSFVNPALTSPAVARAVHQLLPWSVAGRSRLPSRTHGEAGFAGGGGVLAAGFGFSSDASRSSFTETGGTRVAPGHSDTSFTSLIGSI